MSKKILSLPHELEQFDDLIKERVENFTSKKHCLTVMKCIPDVNLEIWNEIHNNGNNTDWFAVELDLENINSNEILKSIYDKAKSYEAQNKINLSQCLVQAHEKHFLYFGHEQEA